MPTVDLLVPGPLDTPTGGYQYDRRIFEGLRAKGWKTRVHTLDSSFPMPSSRALAETAALLRSIPDQRRIVIDGLVLAGLADLLEPCARHHRPIALIHHPLGDETGIAPAQAHRLARAEIGALRQVHRVVVTSAWTRRRLKAMGLEREDVVVIEPGVDLPSVPRTAPGSGVRLLCVASLTPRKGHLLLVEALGKLRHLDWSLDCVGSPDLDVQCAAEITGAISRSGLQGRIRLRGSLSPQQLAQAYAAADLFVLPSYFEGYGMALAEAIAWGVPVVSTTGGAIPATVPAAGSRLIPPGDGEALARELEALLTDPGLRLQLGSEALHAASRLPRWAEAISRFAAMLTELPEA